MWLADTDYEVAPEIKETIMKTVQEEDLHYDYDPELVNLMVEKVNKINRIPVEPNGIYIMQGVTPTMWLACQYACNPGDEAILTDPMYPPFFNAVEHAGAKKVCWPLMEKDEYKFDIERLKELITPRTRMIFICNPHNPTGRVMTKEELSAIADLAVDHDLLIMSDELWEDIIYEGHAHLSIASLGSEISNRTITAFGFSKSYNISGLQVGYAATTNVDMMHKMKIMTSGIFRGTTNISNAVAKTILSGKVSSYLKAELRYLHQTREYALKRMGGLEGAKCNKVEGTYLLFPNVTAFRKTSEELVAQLLYKYRVGVTDGSFFGTNGRGHIRLNIATSLNILQEAFDRIEKVLKKP